MELKHINNNTNYIFNNNTVFDLLSHKQGIKKVKELLSNSDYLMEFVLNIEENEARKLPLYENLSDLALIYYYVHQQTHDDEHKNKKDNTKKEYIRDLLQFFTFTSFMVSQESEGANSVLKVLENRHIRQYQDWLKDGEFAYGKKGYALYSRVKKITIVKGFLNWLYTNECIDYPLHAVFKKVTIRSEDKPDRSLSYHEVKQLLDYYKEHPINHALLLLLATTGLRIMEVANAKWSNLYYDPKILGGRYFLRVQVKGSGTKERHVYIMPSLLESLKRMRKRRGLSIDINSKDDTYLFVTNKKKPYHFKYLSNYIIQIIQNTKLPWLLEKDGTVSPHDFRHYFISHLVIDLGADITKVQKTVGHVSRTTTEGYLDKYLSNQNNAGLLLDERLYE